jgi:hypothetical protein
MFQRKTAMFPEDFFAVSGEKSAADTGEASGITEVADRHERKSSF